MWNFDINQEILCLFFSAKMDATENDVPSSYQVRGFPTIFFAPKNDKNNPRKYEVRLRLKEYFLN
jgi:protein disulfide isomerase family A protein 3